MKTTFNSSSDSDFSEEKPLPKIPCITISDEDSDVDKMCVTQPPKHDGPSALILFPQYEDIM